MRLSSSSLAIARARTSRSVRSEKFRIAAIWPECAKRQAKNVMMRMPRMCCLPSIQTGLGGGHCRVDRGAEAIDDRVDIGRGGDIGRGDDHMVAPRAVD